MGGNQTVDEWLVTALWLGATDIAGLNRDEAAELMQWSAVAMLHHAVAAANASRAPHANGR
jgi:hypothetical protein